jgi:ketosteroid isomerase-like protein
MSQENMELVRSILAAWERGDYSSAEWAHGEIEFVIADGPAPGSWTGLRQMAQGYREFLSAWEGVRTYAEAFRETDSEHVLVLAHSSGRGKESRIALAPISGHTAILFQLRSGKVTRLVTYWDRNRAYADIGFAPEGSD